MPRPLHLLLLFVALAGVSACTRTEARAVPPVALMVPPSPPRIPIPVPLPEPIVEADEPEPEPEEAPAAPSRTRVEVPATRPAAERPSPPPAAVNSETRAPALQTTANVGALEQRATWLLGEAEKNLERVSRAQLTVNARAQYDRAIGFIRSSKNALQNRNFNYAEQLAIKAARLARALVQG